jgi:hypothetical protein
MIKEGELYTLSLMDLYPDAAIEYCCYINLIKFIREISSQIKNDPSLDISKIEIYATEKEVIAKHDGKIIKSFLMKFDEVYYMMEMDLIDDETNSIIVKEYIVNDEFKLKKMLFSRATLKHKKIIEDGLNDGFLKRIEKSFEDYSDDMYDILNDEELIPFDIVVK